MLEELLGQGVVGAPVAGSTLTPEFAPLRDGTWTYQIVGGKNAGQMEQHVVKRLERNSSGASWRYAVGSKEAVFIKQMPDGSLTFLTEEDFEQGVITRYEPPEPDLLTGLAPGDSRSSSVGVQVSDLSDPSEVSHTGTLAVTYSYLGAYKVTTPAGVYDAALIKWAYKGEVGPAKVDDTQYRLFAAKAGMVASVDKLKFQPCSSIIATRSSAKCWPRHRSSRAWGEAEIELTICSTTPRPRLALPGPQRRPRRANRRQAQPALIEALFAPPGA